MAAYVTQDYEGFAVMTAQEIVKEEDAKLCAEIYEEIGVLMDGWLERVGKRINDRMEEVGIAQVLEIEAEWDAENMPTFRYKGATVVGGKASE